MFAKFVGRRATALVTSLAVVIGLAITPALTATAAEGDQPVIVEAPLAELVEAPPAKSSPPVDEAPAPAAEAPAPLSEEAPASLAEEAPAPLAEEAPVSLAEDPAPLAENPAPLAEDPLPLAELVEAPPADQGDLEAQSPIAPLSARMADAAAQPESTGFTPMAMVASSTGIQPNTVGPFMAGQYVYIRFSYPGADRWRISSVPYGLYLYPGTGELAGTVQYGGTYSFTVTAENRGFFGWYSDLAKKTYTVTVGNAAPIVTTYNLDSATVGVAYSQQLTAFGAGPITFRITGNRLPLGLSLSPSGLISGTPAFDGYYAYGNTNVFFGVTANNGRDSLEKILSITVSTPSPRFGNEPLATATAGVAYVQALPLSVGYGPLTYWMQSGNLPGGLALASDGVIRGTPVYDASYAATQQFTFTARVSGMTGIDVKTFTLTLQVAPPTITTTTLPAATVGAAYTAPALTASGDGAITWSATGLPAGLVLDSATGIISGTPDYNAAYGATTTVPVTVTANNGFDSAPQALTLTVTTPAPEITTTTLPDGWWMQAYNQPIAASGPGVVVTVTGLPAGLAFDGENITGSTESAGQHELIVTAINIAGTDTATITLTINDRPNLQRQSPVKVETGGFGFTWISYTGDNVTLSLGPDAPAGMRMFANVVFWTPSTPGVYKFTITATNPAGSDTQEYTFKVFDAPVITQGALDQGIATVNYRQELQHDGTNVKFTVVKGDLPDGITLSRKGVLEGAPTEAGTFQFRVKAQNPVGVDRQWFTITVTEPAMTLSSSSVIRGGSLTVSGTGYLPGDTLELWLHSTPVLLGTVTATGGTFTSTVKIPANTPAGQHHLVVVGTQSGTQSVPLSIALPAAPALQPRSTTQPQSPQPAVTPSVEATAIDESDDSEVEEIVDEAEEELPTLNKPEAAEETAAPAPAGWTGLLLAALVLLLAALLVAFLLWRRRMASGS